MYIYIWASDFVIYSGTNLKKFIVRKDIGYYTVHHFIWKWCNWEEKNVVGCPKIWVTIWELELISSNYHYELWYDLSGFHAIPWWAVFNPNDAKNFSPSLLFLIFPSLILIPPHNSPPLLLSPLCSLFLYLPFSSSSTLLPTPSLISCLLLSLFSFSSQQIKAVLNLWRTIYLVQVKKEFCRKCFTFHIFSIF